MTQQILIVDDSRMVLESLRYVLEDADFEVMSAQSGEEALDLIRKKGLPHLAIVDLHMPPRMSGFDFCKKVLQFSDLPIIMLTADGEEENVVTGLKNYAEDYVVKPFRSSELIARVERVLRRIGDYAYTLDPIVQIDERLSINLALREVMIDGETKSLTPIEAKFLYILMKFAGRTVTTEFLLRRIWPLDEAYEDRLHAHVYRLRRKIEINPKKPNYIIADWSKGYTFPVPETE